MRKFIWLAKWAKVRYECDNKYCSSCMPLRRELIRSVVYWDTTKSDLY